MIVRIRIILYTAVSCFLVFACSTQSKIGDGLGKPAMVAGRSAVLPAVVAMKGLKQDSGAGAGPPVEVAVVSSNETHSDADGAMVPMSNLIQELLQQFQPLFFDFDSYTLSVQARDTLFKNAELLAEQPWVKLRIEGNCDERGSDEYNLALGEQRARTARAYLVNLGIAPDRLFTISYGKEQPLDFGHDEAAWAKNRRDEFVVIK